MGRARAWLRVALMQKKLADYIKVLIDNRDSVLAEYFEPDALMMSEEALVIVGLLVGLNVIDCNLCIKVSAKIVQKVGINFFQIKKRILVSKNADIRLIFGLVAPSARKICYYCLTFMNVNHTVGGLSRK